MSAIGALSSLILISAVAVIVFGLVAFKVGRMGKRELYIYLAGGTVIAGLVLTVAPVTMWDRYEVSGVVEEVHPGGLLELSGGRVVEVQDNRVVTLRKGDTVNMTCETILGSSRNEACQVHW